MPEGEEVYHRRVFYHALGRDPANDPLVFGKEVAPEDWPGVDLSNDGRWLLMEAELIEPDFYLGVDAGAGACFAEALRAQIDAA